MIRKTKRIFPPRKGRWVRTSRPGNTRSRDCLKCCRRDCKRQDRETSLSTKSRPSQGFFLRCLLAIEQRACRFKQGLTTVLDSKPVFPFGGLTEPDYSRLLISLHRRTLRWDRTGQLLPTSQSFFPPPCFVVLDHFVPNNAFKGDYPMCEILDIDGVATVQNWGWRMPTPPMLGATTICGANRRVLHYQ